MERIEREARAASCLDHPNICTIYEVGEHEGRTFLAMQLLESTNLRDHIAGRPLRLDLLLDISTDQTIHQSASSVWILKRTSVPNFQDRLFSPRIFSRWFLSRRVVSGFWHVQAVRFPFTEMDGLAHRARQHGVSDLVEG
jgi:hypothetical protein